MQSETSAAGELGDYTARYSKAVAQTHEVTKRVHTATVAIEQLLKQRREQLNERPTTVVYPRRVSGLESSAIAELRRIMLDLRALAYTGSYNKQQNTVLDVYERLYVWVRRIEGAATSSPCPVCRRNMDRDNDGVVLPHSDGIGQPCEMSGKLYGS